MLKLSSQECSEYRVFVNQNTEPTSWALSILQHMDRSPVALACNIGKTYCRRIL